MNIVDLSYSSQKNKKLEKQLNLIFKNYQRKFVNFVSKAASQKKDNLDIWLSLPISRNTLISKLYYNFCVAIFIKKKIKKNINIDQIVIDSPELAGIIKSYFKKKRINIEIKYKKVFPFFRIIKFLFNFFKFSLKKIYQFLIAKITKKKNKKISTKKLVLIDTFALPNYYNKDRYFNGLTKYLNNVQKKKIFFLPTLTYTSIKNYYSAYNQIRESSSQVILKEDFLNFFDLFFAILHSIRIQFFKFKNLKYGDLDFSELFNSELKNGISDDIAIEGLLNYRFVKRLKENKVQLDTVIDWWENQAVDKGLNKGVQTFYPDTKIVGYLGYFPREFELQLATSKLESKLKYTPKIIAVTGNKIKNKINIFNKNQKIITAPAFRYSYLWKNKIRNKIRNKINIFIALPIVVEDSINILNVVSKIFFIKQRKNFKVFIKPHPTMKIEVLKKYLNKFDRKHFKITFGNIDKLLSITDILISSMSITCLEAIALGIPVINVKRSIGLSFNSIPKEIPREIWRHCSSEKEILNAINFFTYKLSIKSKSRQNIGKLVRKNYFEPVTKKKVINFLNLH